MAKRSRELSACRGCASARALRRGLRIWGPFGYGIWVLGLAFGVGVVVFVGPLQGYHIFAMVIVPDFAAMNVILCLRLLLGSF